MRKVLSVLLVVGVLLGACATPTPQVIKETVIVKETVPVEKVVKETVTVKETVVVKETVPVQVTQVVEKVVTPTPAPIGPEEPATKDKPVALRIGVSLTAQELASVSPAIDALQAKHPEWRLTLEQVPQSGNVEKIYAHIAAGTLPDVQQVQGLFAQPWIRQGAFLNLEPFIAESKYDFSDFYPGTSEEFIWQGQHYGIPYIAAPELIYYNKDMFDKAKLPYPNDDWTWDDLRALARKLTLDKNGRNAEDPAFDPNNIVQWGYSNNPGAIAAWAHFFIEPFGGDFCANPECSRLNFTSEANLNALQWWADFIQKDHATLYDPYTGGQTGVPGDPFIAGKAAMGNSGFFAIGQLRDAASFQWDIVQPPKGPTGKRASVFSTAGWVISAKSRHPREAWRLIQELTSPEFLETVWAKPGHSVPSRRSAAQVVLKLSPPPSNLSAILAAMEYAHPFRPNGPGAFEVYGKIIGLTTAAMKGEKSVKDAYTEAEKLANEILSKAQP